MEVLLTLILLLATAAARECTDEEIFSFPKLFHLDDYERCLAKRDGLYCLGVFDLSPDGQPNPSYDLLKEYSADHQHFNRTRIHRGYCVSSRCPNDMGNASIRFERCVDKYARGRSLRASINTLQYCQTYTERHTEKPTTPAQHIFLQCVYAIIVINIIGTIYDVYTRDTPDKNKLIAAFSIPANWRRLMIIHEGGDIRLTALRPLNGFRVVAMICMTYAHCRLFHYSFYILNPEVLEKKRMDVMWLTEGTSLVQALVMMSCFLTSYNLLIISRKRPLSLSMLPLCIIKRIIRITPVNLLIVSFGSTWWQHMREGPLVPTTIGSESRPCQTKFWSHIFYFNNMVDRTDHCVVPTWFLPVDMHMYIVACTLTLMLWHRRSKAIKLYMALFITACVFIGVVSYAKEYKAMVNIPMPEHLRRVFRDVPSFTSFYISSWGALPSCLLGLIVGHIQFELDEKCIKLSDYKWFVYLHYITSPLVFLWPLTGVFALENSSPFFNAAYLITDRSFHCILICILLLGCVHIDGPIRRFFGWNGWTVLSRMSLAVMLLHWCVNMVLVTRPAAYSTSDLDVIVDWTATNVITYVLAIPITVLVEIPVQKFMGLLIF